MEAAGNGRDKLRHFRRRDGSRGKNAETGNVKWRIDVGNLPFIATRKRHHRQVIVLNQCAPRRVGNGKKVKISKKSRERRTRYATVPFRFVNVIMFVEINHLHLHFFERDLVTIPFKSHKARAKIHIFCSIGAPQGLFFYFFSLRFVCKEKSSIFAA